MSFALSPKTRPNTQPATINNPSHIKPSATPFNTLAPQPASSLAQRHSQGMRPIPKSGQLSGVVPVTTPSSLEDIGRRLAENLLMGNSQHAQPVNRIVPRYERRFNAGLADLHRRLETHDGDPSDKQTHPKTTGNKAGAVRPSASLAKKSGPSIPEDDWSSTFTAIEGDTEGREDLSGAGEKKEG